jgi:hypothetical protein
MTEEHPRPAERYSDLKRAALYAVAIVLTAFALLFAFSLRQIFLGVRDICNTATRQFPGDNVEALMALVESDMASFRDKNSAIWALGQIGDKRALPLLQKLRTGKIQQKPYDSSKYIVQYTVEKAIRHCESTFIVTRWMYRWLPHTQQKENKERTE